MDQIEQGSQEWLELRLGKITASRLSDVLAKGKGNAESITRTKYRNELIKERLTGKKIAGYSSPSMERGSLLEPLARAFYEVKNNLMVGQISFVQHPIIKNAGASPDGLVGEDGLLEIKCPDPANHIAYILDGGNSLSTKYNNQVQFQLCCTGRSWCDLASYDPDIDEDLQMFIVRIYRDDEYIKMMESEVIKFDEEITETILYLKEKRNANDT